MALALIGTVTWMTGPVRTGPLAQVTGATQPGPGTMQVGPGEVAASGKVDVLEFTYTADPNGFLKSGTFTLTVPDGWTTPTSASGTPGYTSTTAQCGSGQCVPTVNNMTITLSRVILPRGGSFIIYYHAATAPSSVLTFDFTAQETPLGKPTASYPTRDLQIPVTTCPNGIGVLTVYPKSVTASTTTDFLFTYTAKGCGLLEHSAVTIDVPRGWTPPSTVRGEPGYPAASQGTVTLSGSRITIADAILAPDGTLTLSYAQAVPASPGYAVFSATEQSGDNAIRKALASPPKVTVLQARSSSTTGPPTSSTSSAGHTSPAGIGTMTVSPATVTASRRSTLTFTYAAPPDGLPPTGAVALAVPRGWTAPTRKRGVPGYTSSSAGTVSVAGRWITVTGTALRPRGTLRITYHAGTAPQSPGQAEFTAIERTSPTARASPVDLAPVLIVAGPAPPGPPWLAVLLGVVFAGTVTVLISRLFRRRIHRRPGPITEVAVVPNPDPPRVAAVKTTGNEPTLALRIEPHAGTTARTLRSQS
jgi:hypothetical protein